MKTLVVTLQDNEIVATIFEHENDDEFARNDIMERCKNSSIITKIGIDGFLYEQYKKINNFA